MMRTTKEQRDKIRRFCEMQGMTEVGLPTHAELIDIIEDLDTLESKLAKAREALKDVITLMSGAPTVSPLTDDVVLARARAALEEIGEGNG